MTSEKISSYEDESIVFNHIRLLVPKESDAAFLFHTHDICEIIFLVTGNVSGVIGAKTYNLDSNNLIIFRSPDIHRIKINSDTVYERYNILFDEKQFANGIFSKISKNINVIDFSQNKIFIDLFKKMDFYTQHFSGDDLKKLVYNLVEEIVFNMFLAKNKSLAPESDDTNPLINKAIEYIETNFRSPITVEDISRHLFISKRYLHYLFLEHFNLSPKKYINSKRMTLAYKLIKAGEKPYNIYQACGFSDYATFYRNFKIQFGHAPSKEIINKPLRLIQS